jgi:hypothetical protein
MTGIPTKIATVIAESTGIPIAHVIGKNEAVSASGLSGTVHNHTLSVLVKGARFGGRPF